MNYVKVPQKQQVLKFRSQEQSKEKFLKSSFSICVCGFPTNHFVSAAACKDQITDPKVQ